MGRYRSRSRSLSPRRSPTPPPHPPRRKHYDEPRDRYRGGRSSYRDRDSSRSSPPTGLLIRNISLSARPEDLRVPFERFGPVKDVYLPKNYYTGEPRGFGFVKYRSPEDAAEAKHQMNHKMIGGREITIVYAEENRKTPQEMRTTPRSSGRDGGGHRRSPPRSSRRQRHSYTPSPSPPRRESRDRNRVEGDYSPQRSISRSPSPRNERDYPRSPSPRGKGARRSPSPRGKGPMRSLSPKGREPLSPVRSPSPRPRNQSSARSPSPRGKGSLRSPSPRRSPSPKGRIRSPSRSPGPPRGRAGSVSPRGRSTHSARSQSYSPRR
ncbi:hypothetical protein ACHQM5_026833 [Ranunculus cassubicifolius]